MHVFFFLCIPYWSENLLSFRFPSVWQPSTIRSAAMIPQGSWQLPMGASETRNLTTCGKKPYSCGHAATVAMLQQTHVQCSKGWKMIIGSIHSGNPCQPSSIKARHKGLNTAQMRKTLLMWPGQKEWRKTVAPAAAQILLQEWSCFCFEVVGRHPRQLYFEQDIEVELKSSQTSKFGNCRILSETPSQLQKVFKVERHGSLSTCFSFGAGRMEGCLETGVLTVLCSNPR